MKASRVLIILGFLSFGLMAVVAFLIQRGPIRANESGEVKPALEAVAANATATAYENRPAEPSEERRGEKFSWRAIESSDYKQYIANLRAIHCPEKTIRDIIIADINKLYAPREAPLKAELVKLPAEPAVTIVSATPPKDVAQRKREFEVRRQLREVEEEKSALIKELLGVELPLSPLRSWSSRNYDRYETALDALSAEKREPVRKILESYWQTSDQLSEKYNLQRTPQFLEEYKQITANRKAQLAQILTAGELEEFEMRTSSSFASRLNSEFREFKPTEQELRELFRLQTEIEDPTGGPGAAGRQDPGEIAQRQNEEREKIKAVLGEERFAEFERAQDGNYRSLAQLGERYNLPKENILQAYQIQQAMNSQLQQLSADPNQNPQDRRQSIQAIMAQNQEALKQLLGDRAYKVLSRGNRNQIQPPIQFE